MPRHATTPCTEVQDLLLHSPLAEERLRSNRCLSYRERKMSKLLRGVAAGYGARKLTGGCGCTGIIVFIILWYVLGHFGIFK
jgi:hypothetical protein